MKTQVIQVAFLGLLTVLAADAFAVKPEDLTPEQIQAAVANKTVLGFWDFLDAAPGTEVSTVANHVTSDLPLEISNQVSFFDKVTPKTGYTEDTFPKPVFIARAPHVRDPRASDSTAYIPLQGIQFFNDPTSNTNFKTGFELKFTGLASTLQQFGDFTIEFFVSWEQPELLDGKDGIWRTVLKAPYMNGNHVRCYCISNPDTFGWRVTTPGNNDATKTPYNNLHWRHAAAVVDKTNGKVRVYVDRQLAKEVEFSPFELDSTVRDVIVGSNGQDGLFSGSIAAFRVTAGALSPEEFLVDDAYRLDETGAVLLLDFKEGTPGQVVTNIINAVDGNYCAKPGAKFESGVTPYEAIYSADRPAQYLVANGAVASENPNAIDFGCSSNKSGTYLTVEDLGRTVAGLEAFTLEGFFKINGDTDVKSGSWFGFFGIDGGSSDGWKFRAGFRGPNQAQLRSYLPSNTGDKYTAAEYVTTYRDGQWHHYAVTYDKSREAGEELKVCVDYVREKSGPWTNIASRAAARKDGYVNSIEGGADGMTPMQTTGIRLTPRVLSDAELLSAQDALSVGDEDTWLWWRFEGEEDEDVSWVERGYGTKFGSTGRLATYATGLPREFVKSGSSQWANTSCARFYGINTAAGRSSTGQSCVYSIASTTSDEACLPDDFTAELFVWCDANEVEITENQAKQAVFQVGWDNKADNLGLQLLLRKTDGGFYLGYRDGDSYVNDALITASGKKYTDAKWHHVAITYASASKTLAVYIDYAQEPVCSKTLTKGLTLPVGSRLMLGSSGYQGKIGFTGQIDEFRVSKKVLAVNEFLKMVNRPGLMLLLR